jgi:hypothetical protein
MAALKSGVTLGENEKLVMEIEAELWASSANPFAQAVGSFYKVLAAILGFKKKAFWVITDKRVVEVSTQVACWCITLGRQVRYILPSSVKEIGYTRKAACGIFCPAYYLYYESFTQLSSLQLKGANEDGAVKAANAFYAAISAAQ